MGKLPSVYYTQSDLECSLNNLEKKETVARIDSQIPELKIPDNSELPEFRLSSDNDSALISFERFKIVELLNVSDTLYLDIRLKAEEWVLDKIINKVLPKQLSNKKLESIELAFRKTLTEKDVEEGVEKGKVIKKS